MDEKQAFKFLYDLMHGKIKNQLLSLESELTKKYQSSASDKLSEQILMAPDVFYATSMMKQNKVFFGNGDFKKTIVMLQNHQNPNFKDIGNKLVLLKTGHLYHKNMQPDLNDEDVNCEGINMYKEDNLTENQRTGVFADNSFDKSPQNRAVNHKQVFKIWACQVYGNQGNQGLTQRQLENIFPEFRARLQLFHNCCDQTGKIVKNKEYYNWYKNQDFAVKSRRGGN